MKQKNEHYSFEHNESSNGEHSHSERFAGRAKPKEQPAAPGAKQAPAEGVEEDKQNSQNWMDRLPPSKHKALIQQLLAGKRGLELRSDALSFIGVSSSKVGISGAQAVKWAKLQPPNYEGSIAFDLRSESFDSLPVGDASTEFVFAANVLEHMVSPVDAINEWLRVVGKGGQIFIVSQSSRNSNGDVAKKIAAAVGKRGTRPSRWNWQLGDLTALAQQQGWKVAATLPAGSRYPSSFVIVLEK